MVDLMAVTDLAQFLNVDLPQHWLHHVVDSDSDIRQRRTALVSWTWAIRGLLLRSDSRAYTSLQDLLGLFADDVLGQDAARSLAILSRDDDGALTKANHAVIKVSGSDNCAAPWPDNTCCSCYISNASSVSSCQSWSKATKLAQTRPKTRRI